MSQKQPTLDLEAQRQRQQRRRKSFLKTFLDITTAYASRFGKDDNQTTVTKDLSRTRQATAAQGANQHYNFATAAYLSGRGPSFHYCPFYPGASIHESIIFYEHQFALLMGLKPGMKVLDVGCGVGGPAREIAKLTGCEIVGITINQGQVHRAIEITAREGLQNQCTFIRGDFLNLPFPPASFDAAYAIEATCHAPSLHKVYSDIARVLKPGAIFGVSEWLMTPGYNPSNTKHVGIRNRIERNNASSKLHTSDECRDAMVKAGFKLFHDEDFGDHWKSLSVPTDDNTSGSSNSARVSTINGNLGNTIERGTTAKIGWHAGTGLSPVTIPGYPQLPRSPNTTSPISPHAQHIPCVLPSPPPTPSQPPTDPLSIALPDISRATYLAPLPNKPTLPPITAPSRYRPWWYPMAGDTSCAETWSDWWIAWRMSRRARQLCFVVVWVLERLRIYPRGTIEAMTTMAYCVDSVVEGGKEGIFTPCWWFIGRLEGDGERERERGDREVQLQRHRQQEYKGVERDGEKRDVGRKEEKGKEQNHDDGARDFGWKRERWSEVRQGFT